jgi:GMP synthase (glutamine-hydrolysing)
MPNVLILQHAEGEWIGSMEHWFADKEYSLSTIRLDHDEQLPEESSFDWLIVMGGPMSVYDESGYPWLVAEKQFIREAIDQNKTVLGICLGGQLIANALGATVKANSQQEIGWYEVHKVAAEAEWLPETFKPLSWHGDMFEVPEKATSLAYSKVTPSQGFAFNERVIALQFHLEAQPGTAHAFLSLEHEGLPSGPTVQTEKELLDDRYLEQSQQVMFSLLDYLNGLPSEF